MTCKHDAIKTWRTDDGTPVMWSCVDCSRKFEPLIVPAAQIHTSVYPEYTPPQRKPLTDELEAAFKDGWQSAKAAHGIKEGT